MIRIINHPNGRRCEMLGFRIHHGQLGLFLIGLGVAFVVHDFRDFLNGFPND